MKLIYCPGCHDVHGLTMGEWRKCLCGESGGQYNEDGMTATLGGRARVFGVGNPFFNELYPYLDVEGKRKMRVAFYGQPDTDAWWGDYPGEQQIFRIFSADGPRLQVKVEDPTSEADVAFEVDPKTMMRVTVTDKRKHWLSMERVTRHPDNPVIVVVPRNPMVDTGRKKKRVDRWMKALGKRIEKVEKESAQKEKESSSLKSAVEGPKHE